MNNFKAIKRVREKEVIKETKRTNARRRKIEALLEKDDLYIDAMIEALKDRGYRMYWC